MFAAMVAYVIAIICFAILLINGKPAKLLPAGLIAMAAGALLELIEGRRR